MDIVLDPLKCSNSAVPRDVPSVKDFNGLTTKSDTSIVCTPKYRATNLENISFGNTGTQTEKVIPKIILKRVHGKQSQYQIINPTEETYKHKKASSRKNKKRKHYSRQNGYEDCVNVSEKLGSEKSVFQKYLDLHNNHQAPDVIVLSDEDDDDNNNSDELINRPTHILHVKSNDELGISKENQKWAKVEQILGELSEILYIIIQSEMQFFKRISDSIKVSQEFVNKEKHFAQETIDTVFISYGSRFTDYFAQLDKELPTQNSCIYYHILHKLITHIREIDPVLELSVIDIKRLMIKLLKENMYNGKVMEILSEDDDVFESNYGNCVQNVQYISYYSNRFLHLNNTITSMPTLVNPTHRLTTQPNLCYSDSQNIPLMSFMDNKTTQERNCDNHSFFNQRRD